MVRVWRGVLQLSLANRPVGELALLRILNWRWQQGGDIENVDVIVFPFRPPVSKFQKLKGKECTVEREIRSSGKVSWQVSEFPPVVSLPE